MLLQLHHVKGTSKKVGKRFKINFLLNNKNFNVHSILYTKHGIVNFAFFMIMKILDF